MKIAVILNGQWRTGIECSPHIKELFSKYDVDYFINTWPEDWYKNIKNESGVLCAESQPTILSDKKITLMKEIYNVSDERYEVNSFDEIGTTFSLENGNESGLLGWYSAWKANNKKIEFEKKNNFVYDVVIRFRPDMIIPAKYMDNFHLKIEQVYTNNNVVYTQYVTFNEVLLREKTGHICTDYYIIASSMNMNLIHNWIDYKFKNKYLSNKEHYCNLINTHNIVLNPILDSESKPVIIREIFKNRRILRYLFENWDYREVVNNSYSMLYNQVSSELMSMEYYSDLIATNEDIELIENSYYLTESGLNNLKNKIFNKFSIDTFKHR